MVFLPDPPLSAAVTPTGKTPRSMHFSGDGEWLYVADYWAGTVTAISIARYCVTRKAAEFARISR
jgi:sugar lactone lactonase YvrE